MTRRTRWTIVLAAALLLALAPVALAARPPAGTKYRGKTSQGRVIDLSVSKSGTGLVMKYREKFRCKGVRDRTFTTVYRKDRPTIAVSGTYKFRKRYSGLRGPTLPGVFAETQRLSGRFNADLSRVSGRSFVRLFGKRFACRSGITFSARRVG